MTFSECFVAAVHQSVHAIFSTMLPWYVKNDSPFNEQPVGLDIVGSIPITGKIQGAISVSFSRSLALQITACLLEEEIPEMNEDVYDAVGEMTNLIAGGIKQALSKQEDLFELGIPTVRATSEIRTPLSGIVIPFHTDRGIFFVSSVIDTIKE